MYACSYYPSLQHTSIFYFLLLVSDIYTSMIGLWLTVFHIYLYYERVLILYFFHCTKSSYQFLCPPFLPILTWIVFIKFTMKFGTYDFLWCQLVPKILDLLANIILKLVPLSHVRTVFLFLDYNFKLFDYIDRIISWQNIHITVILELL